ncbi:MAG: sulfur oxidation c-type cytochrome SoxA [Gammaproteobacteria bacterium]|nr:sulfur oxidation c-type cytochrome SoxA [Gammaproteobacteria bacterium]
MTVLLVLLIAAPLSGSEFLNPETRALQDDPFENPGYLWVDRGAALWSQAGCARCHAPSEVVASSFPRYDETSAALIDLSGRINRCRALDDAPTWGYEEEPLLALTAFLLNRERGTPTEPALDPRAEPFRQAGEAFFRQRRGQLDLSCAHCHDALAGMRLRGERISQGQVNGFPTYRLLWGTLASTHRMFRWCNEAVRSEPFPPGSPEYVNLEYFLRHRGRGLRIETPAVRR